MSEVDDIRLGKTVLHSQRPPVVAVAAAVGEAGAGVRHHNMESHREAVSRVETWVLCRDPLV